MSVYIYFVCYLSGRNGKRCFLANNFRSPSCFIFAFLMRLPMTVGKVDVISDGSMSMPGNSSHFLLVPTRRKLYERDLCTGFRRKKLTDAPKLNRILYLFLVLFHLSSKSEICTFELNYMWTMNFLHLIISEPWRIKWGYR